MKSTKGLLISVAGMLVAFGGLVFACHSQRGQITETWETENKTFRVRVRRYAEENGGFVAGAYYVFESAAVRSDNWSEIMTFRHDDPVAIPREQVRLVNDQIGYIFMGWMYAVTADGGITWSVWDAQERLPGWQCCNYALIREVRLTTDGIGVMTLKPIPQRQGEVPELHTRDYGEHWSVR